MPSPGPLFQENNMPDDVDLLSGMPTPLLVVGGVVVVAVLAVFATVIFKGVSRWSHNNGSPLVTTMA